MAVQGARLYDLNGHLETCCAEDCVSQLFLSANMVGGSGNRLPIAVLSVAGVSTFVAVLVSATSIYLQLKNYRKPALQR